MVLGVFQKFYHPLMTTKMTRMASCGKTIAGSLYLQLSFRKYGKGGNFHIKNAWEPDLYSLTKTFSALMEEIKPHSCCAASTNMFIPAKNCVNPPRKLVNCLGEALKVKQDDASVKRLEAGRWPKTKHQRYIHLGSSAFPTHLTTFLSKSPSFSRIPQRKQKNKRQ